MVDETTLAEGFFTQNGDAIHFVEGRAAPIQVFGKLPRRPEDEQEYLIEYTEVRDDIRGRSIRKGIRVRSMQKPEMLGDEDE